MAYTAGTMRPKGRLTGAGEQAQVSPGGTGLVWQQPATTLQDSETSNTPTRVRQFLKKGVVKFQEVSPPHESVQEGFAVAQCFLYASAEYNKHVLCCRHNCSRSSCMQQSCAAGRQGQEDLQAKSLCSWQTGSERILTCIECVHAGCCISHFCGGSAIYLRLLHPGT